MYPLHQALLEHHLIVLRVLGEWYELDLIGQDNETSADALQQALLEVDFREEFAYLQPEEAQALRALKDAGGRIPVATFVRDFGEVRQMGAGKLDREEPWLNPVSPAEALWYRGFLYRGFDETDTGLVEYYFVPDELLANMRLTMPSAEVAPPPTAAPEPEAEPEPVKPKSAKEEKDLAAALADVEAFIKKTRAARAQTTPSEPLEPEPVAPAPVVTEPVMIEGTAPESARSEPAPEPEPPATPEPQLSKVLPPVAKVVSTVVAAPRPVVQPPKPAPKPQPVTPSAPEKTKAVQPAATLQLETAPHAFQPATTLIVDDLTTILALSQREPIALSTIARVYPFLRDVETSRLSMLIQLAIDAGLLRNVDETLRPARKAADWLKLAREKQLRALFEHWKTTIWNALKHVPTLQHEGALQNAPGAVRGALLNAMADEGGWISAETLIQTIHQTTPDFQRPDGDYDNWYIRDRKTGDFLNGFATWFDVEGRLLHYVLQGPMGWLGLVDVSEDATAIRLTARAKAFVAGRTPQAHEVDLPIIVQADATMLVPTEASRYQRFQATRIAEPQPLIGNQPYLLRITPSSLAQATDSGIKPQRVLQFLQDASGNRPIPAGTRRAIERWGENGTEGRLESVVVLRVGDAAVIETLRNNPKTRDLLGESLGELAVAVSSEHYQALRQITAQLGLLLDDLT